MTKEVKQEQGEPVAWINKERNTITWDKLYTDMDALYTTPQNKEWVGLTNEQIVDLVIKNAGFPTKLAEAIEAKLKEKNT